ncbi:hypothetical protein TCAL_11553 [Tigriopus californicus]|uniref:Uncharacterized protein n=1 Tax=Tigriopus californicus TaxID=6832 RepID=A0A553PI27_TIGCA|nr:uncharacterized protein LOC131880317 [Tigriopus californicus]TRY77333.1 hypothetical protein TCAL_11553 [Tigriopus californicus]
MKACQVLLLLGLVALAAASPQRSDRDRDRDGDGRRGGGPRRGGPRDRDEEREDDGECREAKLDSKRGNCRKAVVIVDEATECADATGPVEFLSPQEICQDNSGQNVYVCKIKGRREVMDLVESFLEDKLGDEAGRREIRDELCNESADFSDLDLSSLQIEEGTSKRCMICP